MQFHDDRWKAELAVYAKQIETTEVLRSSPDDDLFLAERPIMYSAFILRKLIEDKAVTDSLASRSVDVHAYPSTRNGRAVFLEVMLGQLEVQNEFDLNAPFDLRVSYYDLASEIVHADGFIWISEDEPVQSFGVFSYRNFLNRMILVPKRLILEVIGRVVEDKPTRWINAENLQTGRITRHVLTEREYVRMTTPTKK